MDQQRRTMLFLVLSFGASMLWIQYGLPFFYPEIIQQRAKQQVAEMQEKLEQSDAPAKPSVPGEKATDKPGDPAAPPAAEDAKPQVEVAESQKLPDFPRRKITLGSLDPDTNVFMQVELTSRGGAVQGLWLNDVRYRELTDRGKPLRLLGQNLGRSSLSFDLQMREIDRLLQPQGHSLDTIHWEVDDETLTDRRVTFRYPSPDGRWRLSKTYELREGNPNQRDTDPLGYQMQMTLAFENMTTQPQFLEYELRGPVGFPLENVEHTRQFQNLQAGFLRSGSVRHTHLSAKEIVDQELAKGAAESLKAPVRFVGVDEQYFAALLVPEENQEAQQWIAETQPLVMEKRERRETSLISLTLQSAEMEVAAGERIEHAYTLFAGPKRAALLRPFDADAIIEYGWFGGIVKLMLWIMNSVHRTLGLPYGLAIITLTVIVRGAMYPISRKHAMAAKKMKEMQPRFEEIRKKYENDKEKLAKAQMELMKESGFFSGCLPMLLQLPIFIGLYQALMVSVDLRMAQFLWIDNLAAPDRLIPNLFPFEVWFIGRDLNLLPIITVSLFVVQQKLFAPPPANEEQALQQKMMGYMMIFIGVMFYSVPAGLCVYFIASSMWAIAERKMLDFQTSGPTTPPPGGDSGGGSKPGPKQSPDKAPSTEEKKPSWLRNVMTQLDAAANPGSKRTPQNPKPGGKKKKKPHGSKW